MGLRSDLESVAKGWRWTHRTLQPRNVGLQRLEKRVFPTAWARTPAARAARAGILKAGFGSLLRYEIDARVSGDDVLTNLEAPVIFIANHSSHLDAPLILTSLPPWWRDRTAVGAASDYFFDVWWRAAATSLAFNTFPVERVGSRRSTGLSRALLKDGWNLLLFPEGTRSKDGWIADFKRGPASLAISAGVPVVPIGVRGSYQAMPRGRAWPIGGRPPVSVRFGRPLHPSPDDDTDEFTTRLRDALDAILEEDRTTWWAAISGANGNRVDTGGPDAPHWRRVWEASRPVERQSRPRVWD